MTKCVQTLNWYCIFSWTPCSSVLPNCVLTLNYPPYHITATVQGSGVRCVYLYGWGSVLLWIQPGSLRSRWESCDCTLPPPTWTGIYSTQMSSSHLLLTETRNPPLPLVCVCVCTMRMYALSVSLTWGSV